MSSCCPRALGGVRPSVIFKRAKKEFGTTGDPREAGWILPDGSMLDFSEKSEGGPPGQRSLDHRAVARLFPRKEYEKFEHSMGGQSLMMLEFCYKGAVRMSVEGQGHTVVADVCRPLTGAQVGVLRRVLQDREEAIIDIECPGRSRPDAGSVWSDRSGRRLHPDAVINWIQSKVKECK